LKNIAGLQTDIPLRPLAVDLDPLQADVLLQQGRGEQRQVLGHKAVQPLSGVIFSNGKFPHEHPPFSLWTALIIPAFSRVVKRGTKIKEAKL